MAYRILNIDFEPNGKRVNYAVITHEYKKLAGSISQAFMQAFEKEIHSADEAVKKIEDMSAEYFGMAIDAVVNQLCKKDIYSVDHDAFLTRLTKTEIMQRWVDEYQEILDKYDAIEAEANGEKEYRQARKDARGRVIGGGFGVEGAVKGMATAGAINVATGMAHSLFNAVGNMATNYTASKEKRALFGTISKRLGLALYESILDFRFVTIRILEEEGKCFFDFPDAASVEKETSLLANVISGRIPEEKIAGVIHQILILNPFDEQIYQYLLSLCGDRDGTLERLGEALKIDVQEIKRQQLDAALSDDLTALEKKYEHALDKIEFERELLKLQNSLTQLKAVMGYAEELKAEKRLAEDIEEAIKQNRTVENIVFPSADEAKKAKQDLAMFDEFVKQNGIDEEDLKERIRQLPFQTGIVTDTLDQRIERLRAAADPTDIPDKVMDIFQECCFYDSSINSYISKDSLMKQLFIPGISAEAERILEEAKRYMPIDKGETIAFILKGKSLIGNKFAWFIMGNAKLYLFRIQNEAVSQRHIIRYLDVEKIAFNRMSQLTIFCKDGERYAQDMSLSGIDYTVDDGANDMMEAFAKIMELLMPITKCRDLRPAPAAPAEKTAQLDISPWKAKFTKLREACDNKEKFDKSVVFLGVSEGYNRAVLQQRSFWQSEFHNETIYLMINCYTRGELYAGLMLTDRAFYHLKAGQVAKSTRVKISDVKRAYQKGFMETLIVETNNAAFTIDTYSVPSGCEKGLTGFLDGLIQALKPCVPANALALPKPANTSEKAAVSVADSKEKTCEERIAELKECYAGKTLSLSVRDCCLRCKASIGASNFTYNESKLRKQFGIPMNELIFLANDSSLLSSGKEGFAITSRRLWCRSGGMVYTTELSDFKNYRDIHWDGFSLYMRSRLIFVLPWMGTTGKEEMEALYADIAMLVSEVFRGAEKAAIEKAANPPAQETVTPSGGTTQNGTSLAQPAEAPSASPNCQTEAPRSVATPADKQKQIKALCKEFVASNYALYAVTPKLIDGLGLAAYQDIYFAYDATMFGSGKNGFAITDKGFVCRNMFEKTAGILTFERAAAAKRIDWQTGDKIDLTADGLPFLYVSGMPAQHRDKLKALVEAIVAIMKAPDAVDTVRDTAAALQTSQRSEPTAPTKTSSLDEIRKYKALLDDGIITQAEFEAKKKQLLGL